MRSQTLINEPEFPVTELTLGPVSNEPNGVSSVRRTRARHNPSPEIGDIFNFNVGWPTLPPPPVVAAPDQSRRARRKPNSGNEAVTVPPPYPWATDKIAKVHTLRYLQTRRITRIRGLVQCKKCQEQYEIEFDLIENFRRIRDYIVENKLVMCQRAPEEWRSPVYPDCARCLQENCVRPFLPSNKEEINWLFLLLGQMLGCCTLEQLKYFCKWTENHRTGAKDRILYLTYLALCKQLQPDGPFKP